MKTVVRDIRSFILAATATFATTCAVSADEPLRTNRAGTEEHFQFVREGEHWHPLGFLCEHAGAVTYARGPLASMRGPEGALRREVVLTSLARVASKQPLMETLTASEPARWSCQGETCRARYDHATLGVRQEPDAGAWEDRLFMERSGAVEACDFLPHRYASCLTPHVSAAAVERDGGLELERVDRASGAKTVLTGGKLEVEGELFTLRFGGTALTVSGDPGSPAADLKDGTVSEPCQVYVVSPTYLAQRLSRAR